MKKIQKIFLAFLLMLSVQVGITPVKAATITLRYFNTETKVFNGSAVTVEKVTEGLSKIKDVLSFSFLTRYSTTSTGSNEFHSLFFVGKENVANDYVNLYVKLVHGNGSRVGVELRKGTDNKS